MKIMKANRVYFTTIWPLMCYLSTVNADADCRKPPRHVPFHLCCKLPETTHSEIVEQCAQVVEFPGPGPIKHSHRLPMHFHDLYPPPPCAAECFFNKTGIFDEYGHHIQEKFDNLVDADVKDDEELAAILKASFTTCSDSIDQLSEEMKEDISKAMTSNINNPNFCPPFAAMIWHCINMETFSNCPASAWNDSVECNAHRDFFKECVGKKPE